MLEKNKDYIEFLMRTMMVTHRPYQEDTEIAITGMVPGEIIIGENNPFNIPGDVVMIPKRDFEKLQAENQHYRELAKQWEKSYKALLDKTGFYNLADLLYHLPKDKTLKGIIDSCETENEELKKKLHEPDPFADYFELIGFSSIEEIQDYLTNEAEADTLHEAILKLKDQVKYTCDEWYSANSSNNSWKAAAECNSPKELMEKIEGFETEIIDLKTKNTEYACKIQDLIVDSCGRKTVIEAYKRDIERWKEATGCPSPIMAKTLIESGMSYEHGYHEVQEENRKLADNVKSWQNATGYSTPEDFLSAMINNKPQSLYSWQKATGCKTPEEAKSAIRYYKARLGNAVQSASIAMKMLGNSVQSEANAMEILEAISYIDPIKED